MQSNYFHRNCNKTARRFFEDFDLLPPKYKELLWDQPRMPTLEDVRVCWELAAEEFGLNLVSGSLLLNAFEEDRKEHKAEQARREREARKAEKRLAQHKKYGWVQTYRKVTQLREVDPKQARLVQRVTEEQVEQLISKRAENKDVVAAGPLKTTLEFTGWKKVTELKEPPVNYLETGRQNHVTKQWHNG
jgi:hypothetical protein